MKEKGRAEEEEEATKKSVIEKGEQRETNT
jgi:hypothetical protein